jgi:hypothetical protein
MIQSGMCLHPTGRNPHDLICPWLAGRILAHPDVTRITDALIRQFNNDGATWAGGTMPRLAMAIERRHWSLPALPFRTAL